MYEFMDYGKQTLPLADVLAEIDKVLSHVALPREQHLAFHIALQQTITKLENEKVQGT